MSEKITRKYSDAEVQKALFTWWAGLEEHHRGDRPALQRCRTIDEVLMTEAYHRARGELRNIGYQPEKHDVELATVIGLLAHVRQHVPAGQKGRSLAFQMARGQKEGEGARVSGLRFRRLLQARDRDELYTRLMGVIRLLDRSVDVNLLANDAFYWRAETSNTVRRKWAEDYWAAAPQET